MQFSWGTESGQLDPGEAAGHALAIIQVAVAAEIDAVILEVLTDPDGLNLPTEAAVRFLGVMRERITARTGIPRP